MTTLNFDLLFLSPRESDQLGAHPIATVYVKFTTGKDYGGQGTGKSFVSHECVSYQEFSHEIDRLQGELERLRIAARLKFGEAAEQSASE
jgi:hypothetical protein